MFKKRKRKKASDGFWREFFDALTDFLLFVVEPLWYILKIIGKILKSIFDLFD